MGLTTFQVGRPVARSLARPTVDAQVQELVQEKLARYHGLDPTQTLPHAVRLPCVLARPPIVPLGPALTSSPPDARSSPRSDPQDEAVEDPVPRPPQEPALDGRDPSRVPITGHIVAHQVFSSAAGPARAPPLPQPLPDPPFVRTHACSRRRVQEAAVQIDSQHRQPVRRPGTLALGRTLGSCSRDRTPSLFLPARADPFVCSLSARGRRRRTLHHRARAR